MADSKQRFILRNPAVIGILSGDTELTMSQDAVIDAADELAQKMVARFEKHMPTDEEVAASREAANADLIYPPSGPRVS